MTDIVEPHARDRVLPGDTTEPTWVLASIMFGLLALTGSITLISLVASAVGIAWVIYAGRPDGGRRRAASRSFRRGLGPSSPWT
jgi:hypothetical protein